MGIRLIATVLALAFECACASAPRTRSFTDLPKYLDPGNMIRVTEKTGPTSTGRLETLFPASLTMLTDGHLRDMPEHDVARIQRPERHIGLGALIGLGVGLGVGLATARSSEPSGSPFVDAQVAGANVIGGMVLGAAAGAIIGAVFKVHRTVYAPSIPTGMTDTMSPLTAESVSVGSCGASDASSTTQQAAARGSATSASPARRPVMPAVSRLCPAVADGAGRP